MAARECDLPLPIEELHDDLVHSTVARRDNQLNAESTAVMDESGGEGRVQDIVPVQSNGGCWTVEPRPSDREEVAGDRGVYDRSFVPDLGYSFIDGLTFRFAQSCGGGRGCEGRLCSVLPAIACNCEQGQGAEHNREATSEMGRRCGHERNRSPATSAATALEGRNLHDSCFDEVKAGAE